MEEINLQDDFTGFINLFISSSKWAITEFYSALGTNDLREAYDRLNLKREDTINGIFYSFHGNGIFLKLKSMTIDIDFLPNYSLGGFDASRLSTFYEENFTISSDYDYRIFEKKLKELEQNGVIKKFKGKNLYVFT
ncbi:DUF6896 domain-containing protein [Alkanindiges illinoisensis]|uniref:DUF6896 domain-containing protein n=1 Tax=Alkanindiges illinoisensis TaxID=197183 RepID=UPI00047BBEE8|nr:hypothetical protein [Alkanindiges illinoisensis]